MPSVTRAVPRLSVRWFQRSSLAALIDDLYDVVSYQPQGERQLLDLRFAQFARVALTMKKNVAFDPFRVSLPGLRATVFCLRCLPYAIEEFRLLGHEHNHYRKTGEIRNFYVA